MPGLVSWVLQESFPPKLELKQLWRRHFQWCEYWEDQALAPLPWEPSREHWYVLLLDEVHLNHVHLAIVQNLSVRHLAKQTGAGHLPGLCVHHSWIAVAVPIYISDYPNFKEQTLIRPSYWTSYSTTGWPPVETTSMTSDRTIKSALDMVSETTSVTNSYWTTKMISNSTTNTPTNILPKTISELIIYITTGRTICEPILSTLFASIIRVDICWRAYGSTKSLFLYIDCYS